MTIEHISNSRAMGAGASAMPSNPKEVSDEQIKEMAAQLKPDALALLKKVVAAAEGTAPSTDGTAGGDMVGPKKSKKGDFRPPIQKLGNSEDASVYYAPFLWTDAEQIKEVLEEFDMTVPKVSGKLNGAMLVMDEVEWMNAEQQKMWPETLKKIGGKFFEDQVTTDPSFVFAPPDKLKEHCVFLWDEKTADAFLEKNGIKKLGKTGKALLDPFGGPGLDDDAAYEKLMSKLNEEAVLFFKDAVLAAEG